jgi:hypothetical protein
MPETTGKDLDTLVDNKEAADNSIDIDHVVVVNYIKK